MKKVHRKLNIEPKKKNSDVHRWANKIDLMDYWNNPVKKIV